MALALLITFFFVLFVWLVFFKFKWLKFSPAWAVVSASASPLRKDHLTLPPSERCFLTGREYKRGS